MHWTPENDNTGNVKWGLEFTWASINDDYGNTTIIYATEAIDTNGDKHIVTDLGSILGTGKGISSVLDCRVFRDITVASNYGSKAFVHYVDFHFTKDTEGSRQEWVK